MFNRHISILTSPPSCHNFLDAPVCWRRGLGRLGIRASCAIVPLESLASYLGPALRSLGPRLQCQLRLRRCRCSGQQWRFPLPPRGLPAKIHPSLPPNLCPTLRSFWVWRCRSSLAQAGSCSHTAGLAVGSGSGQGGPVAGEKQTEQTRLLAQNRRS